MRFKNFITIFCGVARIWVICLSISEVHRFLWVVLCVLIVFKITRKRIVFGQRFIKESHSTLACQMGCLSVTSDPEEGNRFLSILTNLRSVERKAVIHVPLTYGSSRSMSSLTDRGSFMCRILAKSFNSISVVAVYLDRSTL